MYSTRKVPRQLGAACSSHAAAADAEAAGVAEAAEVAADVAAADADGAELAVCRGVLAASVNPDRLPITLTSTGHLAGFDKVDPAKPCVPATPLSAVTRALAYA